MTFRNSLLVVFLPILLLLIAVVILARVYAPAPCTTCEGVSDFESCTAAENPVLESFPRQCRTPDGQSFTESLPGKTPLGDLIRVSFPLPHASIASPLKITGEARGSWFFEASFPVELLDAEGNQIAQAIATAKDGWMTTEIVPFEATIEFSQRGGKKEGALLLKKDNPSGLPEHDETLVIPVRFQRTLKIPSRAGRHEREHVRGPEFPNML